MWCDWVMVDEEDLGGANQADIVHEYSTEGEDEDPIHVIPVNDFKDHNRAAATAAAKVGSTDSFEDVAAEAARGISADQWLGKVPRARFSYELLNLCSSSNSLVEGWGQSGDDTVSPARCTESRKRRRDPQTNDTPPNAHLSSSIPRARADADPLADFLQEDIEMFLGVMNSMEAPAACPAPPAQSPVNELCQRKRLAIPRAPEDAVDISDIVSAREWARNLSCAYFSLFIELKQNASGNVYRNMIHWSAAGRNVLRESHPSLRNIVDEELVAGNRAGKKYLVQIRFPVIGDSSVLLIEKERERAENFKYVQRLCVFLGSFMGLPLAQRTQALCSIGSVIEKHTVVAKDKKSEGYRVRSCSIMIALFEHLGGDRTLANAAEVDGNDGGGGTGGDGGGFAPGRPSDGPSEGPSSSPCRRGGGGSGCSRQSGGGGGGNYGGGNDRNGNNDDDHSDENEDERITEMKKRIAEVLAPLVAAIVAESNQQQCLLVEFIRSMFRAHYTASVDEIMQLRPEVSQRLSDGKAAIKAVSKNAIALRPTVQEQCKLLVRAVNQEWSRGSAEHNYVAGLSLVAASDTPEAGDPELVGKTWGSRDISMTGETASGPMPIVMDIVSPSPAAAGVAETALPESAQKGICGSISSDFRYHSQGPVNARDVKSASIRTANDATTSSESLMNMCNCEVPIVSYLRDGVDW